MNNKIDYCIKKVPELYQRIYKHPEYDNNSSRICDDRGELIVKIIREYQRISEKKEIKILDVGCAQGYYCFLLKEQGYDITGIDYNIDNIELCQAINEENNFNITFVNSILTQEFAEHLSDKQFDIIIVLNVFHHIAHEKGYEYAKNILYTLAKKTFILITELALKEEPLYWNVNLPANHRFWVQSFLFFKEMTFFSTHLSDIKRPFLFCSNHYALCNGILYKFDNFLDKSFVHGYELTNKRIYLYADRIIKVIYQYDGNSNSINTFKEAESEIDIINRYKSVISFLPEVIDFEKNEEMIIYVMKIVRGTLLYDLILEGKLLNYENIIIDVLNNLIELENNKLYHNDIRLWNIVIDENDRSFLIDIGSIKHDNKLDCADNWFGGSTVTVFDSFITFVYDLITHKDYSEIPNNGFYFIKRHYLDRNLPDNYSNFFKVVGSIDSIELTYNKIKDLFFTFVINNEDILNDDINYKLLLNQVNKLESDYFKLRTETRLDKMNMRDLLNSQNYYLQTRYTELQSQYTELQTQHIELQTQHTELQSQHIELQSQHTELQSQYTELQSQNHELQSQNHELQTHYKDYSIRIDSLTKSYSWKITAPLRWSLKLFKNFNKILNKGLKKIFMLFRKLLRSSIILTGRFVLKINFIAYPIKKVLARYPNFYNRLDLMMNNRNRKQHLQQLNAYKYGADLSPRAREIYNDLKQAMEDKGIIK